MFLRRSPAGVAPTNPACSRRNATYKRLQLHAKAFDAVVALRVPAAETLEALEQLLPAGALEHGASGAAEPAGGGDDEAAEAGGAAVLGLLRSSRRDGGGEGGGCAFLSCVRVLSRPCQLHGRSGSGAPLLSSSRVLLQAHASPANDDASGRAAHGPSRSRRPKCLSYTQRELDRPVVGPRDMHCAVFAQHAALV